MSDLKDRLTQAMKDAMRAKDKPRLGVLRMALAAIKQVEIDERIEVDAARTLALLDKQIKQRDDAAQQYQDAARSDLADIERIEAAVLREFLPTPLTTEEIAALIDAAVTSSGATSMRDMGAVMATLKPQLQGRADIGAVSKQIKARLA